MHTRWWGLCALFLLFAAPLRSEILQSDNLEAILQTADRDTFVVLDIWETLIVPAQWLGGPRSERELIRNFERQGVSRDEAVARTREILTHAHRTMAVRPVDTLAPLLLANLQQQGISLIGQTCISSTSIGYLIADQLALIGIDLKRSANPRCDVELKSGDFIEGILFVKEEKKRGEALVQLLNYIKYTPQRILVIDNDEAVLKEVDLALKAYGVKEVDVVLYRRAADWDRGYRQEVVDVQAHYLGRILSDDEAQKLINAGIES